MEVDSLEAWEGDSQAVVGATQVAVVAELLVVAVEQQEVA